MSMSQQYSLRWNNHQPNFISMFTSLLSTQTLVDVTLAAEGRQLMAHKVVLSACSTYFQSLFVDNPSRHPIVILKDVTFADLRTMVDFIYYGEVNVTEEQLPKVLDTAKLLKIKGLTEMPDSTSLTRAPGADAGPHAAAPAPAPAPAHTPPGDLTDAHRPQSPSNSPTSRRKRRRKSSAGSSCLAGEEGGTEEAPSVEVCRDAITLSSVPHHRRDYEHIDNTQQATEGMNVESLGMEAGAGMAQERFMLQGGLKLRRLKLFKRQARIGGEEAVRKQTSEPAPVRKQSSEPAPAPSTAPPTLQKHESYPQYRNKKIRGRTVEQAVGSLLIRAVSVELAGAGAAAGGEVARASHTPAVRAGPPLSCNFCWNTVDDSGRILRRKTQYHCPECRKNLCIVPCFHEYHDDAPPATASAVAPATASASSTDRDDAS